MLDVFAAVAFVRRPASIQARIFSCYLPVLSPGNTHTDGTIPNLPAELIEDILGTLQSRIPLSKMGLNVDVLQLNLAIVSQRYLLPAHAQLAVVSLCLVVITSITVSPCEIDQNYCSFTGLLHLARALEIQLRC